MKPDPLRIELRKIGGGFWDGMAGRGTMEVWAVLMCHAEQPQEFVLAMGDKMTAIDDTIKRVETILVKLNEMKKLHENDT